MKDKVNKLFSALVRKHWILYWFIFLIVGLVIFHFAPSPMTRMDFINKEFYYFVIFPCIFLCGFFCRAFYTYEELNAIARTRRLGYPNTDNYFYTKINSDIGTAKKLFGYLYVLTKLTSWVGVGYIMGICLYEQYILGNNMAKINEPLVRVTCKPSEWWQSIKGGYMKEIKGSRKLKSMES